MLVFRGRGLKYVCNLSKCLITKIGRTVQNTCKAPSRDVKLRFLWYPHTRLIWRRLPCTYHHKYWKLRDLSSSWRSCALADFFSAAFSIPKMRSITRDVAASLIMRIESRTYTQKKKKCHTGVTRNQKEERHRKRRKRRMEAHRPQQQL